MGVTNCTSVYSTVIERAEGCQWENTFRQRAVILRYFEGSGRPDAQARSLRQAQGRLFGVPQDDNWNHAEYLTRISVTTPQGRIPREGSGVEPYRRRSADRAGAQRAACKTVS